RATVAPWPQSAAAIRLPRMPAPPVSTTFRSLRSNRSVMSAVLRHDQLDQLEIDQGINIDRALPRHDVQPGTAGPDAFRQAVPVPDIDGGVHRIDGRRLLPPGDCGRERLGEAGPPLDIEPGPCEI